MSPRSALALAVLLAGCQPAEQIAPVAGRATLDGKPLADVHVSFQPIAGEGQMYPGGGSYAITDADGKFRLLLVEDERPGAVVGKHRVEFTARAAAVPDDIDLPTRPPPRVMIPDQFGRSSTLTYEVPPDGTSAADFDLKSR